MVKKEQQIKKLIQLNDELDNYFKKTNIPQLFVDADLILQKFTSQAMKKFNLSIDDAGKSMRDIRYKFHFPSILYNIQQIIENNTLLDKRIKTSDFKFYQMHIIPYLTTKDNIKNGVIITFI